jgi:hypothetical protein
MFYYFDFDYLIKILNYFITLSYSLDKRLTENSNLFNFMFGFKSFPDINSILFFELHAKLKNSCDFKVRC